MRKGMDKLMLVGLSLAAAVASTTALRANPAVPYDQCTVTANDTLRIRSGEQNLTVSTSDSLADPVTASFDMASKITVSNVTRETQANTHRLTVDATEAMAGSWKLTLRSGMTECTGDVNVVAATDTTPRP